MKKHLLAVALLPLLAIGGCAAGQAIQAAAGLTVTQDELNITRQSYNALFLTPAARYRQLGYCATGTSATLLKPCADRTIVAKLQATDNTVKTDFDNVQTMITAGTNTGLTAAYSVLKDAISSAESLAVTYGVK